MSETSEPADLSGEIPSIDELAVRADEKEVLAADLRAEGTAAAVPSSRFRPMPMPSGPFWLALFGTVAVVLIVIAAWSVIFMFGIGLALAFILLPIVNWLTRRGVGRTLASGVVALLLVVVVALLLIGALAILINQGIPFLQAIPGYVDDLHQQVVALQLPAWIESTLASVSDAVDKAIESVNPASVVLGFLQGALSVIATLLSFLVIPFFLVFFMRDQPKIAANFFNGIPVPWRVHVDYVVRVFKDDFADYFKAEIIVGLIMGVIISVGVFVIGLILGAPNALMEFALLLGLIAAVLDSCRRLVRSCR